MLLIPCPYCGPRAEVEFVCGGEAYAVRPAEPVSDADWTAYLFERRNPKGAAHERWFHAAGCRRWFLVERDTVTHEIMASRPPGETPP